MQSGLSVRINLEPDKYLDLKNSSSAAIVRLHNPYSFPDNNIHEVTADPGREKKIVVSADQVQSSLEVRELSPEIRKCSLPSDTKYKSGYEYNYNICKAKREMTRFSQVCGCVPFYFPDTCQELKKICDFNSVKCIQKHRGKMFRKVLIRIKLNVYLNYNILYGYRFLGHFMSIE